VIIAAINEGKELKNPKKLLVILNAVKNLIHAIFTLDRHA